MAGESTKSTSLSNYNSGIIAASKLAKAEVYNAMDTYQFPLATSLEAGDNLIMNIALPSNAIILSMKHINDDMDTNACPTLVIDVGLAAREPYTSVTNGTATKHLADDIIDADLFVDGSTAFQAATTDFTEISAKDATTFGPEDRLSPIWTLLGYDSDPHTTFNLVVQSQAAAAALGAAADLAIYVQYVLG